MHSPRQKTSKVDGAARKQELRVRLVRNRDQLRLREHLRWQLHRQLPCGALARRDDPSAGHWLWICDGGAVHI